MTATAWPLQRDCVKFYGNPRLGTDPAHEDWEKGNPQWEAENIASIPCPWELRYKVVNEETGEVSWRPVSGIRIHKLCAESLARILNAIWERVGRSQEEIDRIGMSVFGGSHNFRSVRNGKALSMHSFGCAVDFDPDRNGMNSKNPTMDRLVVEAFEAEGWEWGQHWKRNDPMHFQAVWTAKPPPRLGRPRKPAQEVSDQRKPATLSPAGADAAGIASVYSKTTERLQGALKALGYHEVGMIDGRYGKRTRGALLAFKADNGLPLTEDVDQSTWAVLASAHPRDVSETRADATDAPSLGAKVGKTLQGSGAGTGALGLLGLLLAPFGGVSGVTDWLVGAKQVAETATQTINTVGQTVNPFRDLLSAIGSNWHVLTIGAGLALFYFGRQLFADELESFRRGEWS